MRIGRLLLESYGSLKLLMTSVMHPHDSWHVLYTWQGSSFVSAIFSAAWKIHLKFH